MIAPTRFLVVAFFAASIFAFSCPACGAPAPRPALHEYVTPEELSRIASETPDQGALGAARPEPPSFLTSALTWTFLGPRPITNEGWSGGADASGRISAIVVDPRDGDVIYMAAAQGGVWKSTDGGATWTPLGDGLSSLSSGALALDPSNPDVVYYGTGEQHYSIDSFYGDGLFRSTDAGTSWVKIATKTSVGSYIARVAVDPGDPNVLLVASDRGLVRSQDGGSTWAQTLAGWCNDLAVDSSAPNNVYAAKYGTGIYKSTDSGATWGLLAGGLPVAGLARINLAIAPSNPLVLYASFVNGAGSLYGMYKTTDGGSTWSLLAGTPDYLGGQGWYDNCVVVNPSNPDVCIAGGLFPYGPGNHGVIKTTDGGTNWTDITVGIDGVQVHPDQHILAYGPDGRLWIGNDGGVWSTADEGLHWANRNHDLGVTQFYTAAIHPTDSNFLLGGTQDNGPVRFAGVDAWPQVTGGDGGPCAVQWDSPNIYYTTYVRMTSIDKWNNGSYLGNFVGPWASDRASWCNGPLVTDPNVPNSLLAGTYRVWRTTTGGASWTLLSGDLAPTSGYLLSLAVAVGASNTIYAGSSNGRLYVTTDAANWILRNTGLPSAPIPDVLLSPSDWQTAYLCCDRSTAGRVFLTSNAGQSWTSVTGDLPAGVRGMSLAVDFRFDPARLYLGTDYGVYASSDGGSHWAKASANIPSLAVYDLYVDTANDYLVAATHGRGMWRAPLDMTTAAARDPEPAGLTLEMSSGNPVRFPAAFRYAIPGRAQAALEIYDAAGRLVRVLDRGVRDSGAHTIAWDGHDESGRSVASGIFFIRLRAGDLRMSRRIALVR